MAESGKSVEWLYVVVCDPGANEHFFGLREKEQEIDFIPAFRSREEAMEGLLALPREKGRKYEVQAVHIEELTETAKKNGFTVAIVDKDGHIVK